VRRPSPRSTRSFPPLPRKVVVGVACLVAAVAAGCGAVGRVTSGNASTGKQLFVKTCGGCHTLQNAGTTGTAGPNLDEAFAAAKASNFRSPHTLQTIRDLVRGQIAYAESDPGTGKPGMPPNLLVGQQAKDVAVYVAQCAADPHCTLPGSK
jgi:mono/diheme cytochrome c family protein